MKRRLSRLLVVMILLAGFLPGAILSSFPKPALAANSPQTQWSITYGGTNGDWGYGVRQTSDGGYVIIGQVGTYDSATGGDVWMIKTDSSGTKQWDKTFGGALRDLGYSVAQTSDGGFVITGYTRSYGAGSTDMWLIKTDLDGNKLWDKTFGSGGGEQGVSVYPTLDGGYIVAGSTTSFGTGGNDAWLIKTNGSGDKQWDKTFGGLNNDEAFSVAENSDGSYVITGYTMSAGLGGYDAWLIKTDVNGNEVWRRTFGGPGNDWGYEVRTTSDGGYIISGMTTSYGAGHEDMWLIKTDGSGNIQWSKTFGGTSDDWGYSVYQTSEGGYLVAGTTSSFGSGGSDFWLVKTDSAGNKLWDRTFGGTHNDESDGSSAIQTSDGGYIVTGGTKSYGSGDADVWLIKVAPENQPPLAVISVTPYVASVGSQFSFDGKGSTDPDGTIVRYDWNFGDNTSATGISADHSYALAGLYNVTLTVADDAGASASNNVLVAVYDPNAGFATGGGWFTPGGTTSDIGDQLPGLDGKSPARFGFVVKYKPGATIPDGQLEFQYRQGDFNLHSSGMDWLVIVNSNWAKFQGTATIKGLSGFFPFRVDARDGNLNGGNQPDRFIIKIWLPSANPDTNEPIYKASGDLQGGSIIIHTK